MIKEILEAIKEFTVRFVSSRLFALGLIFSILFAVLGLRLFNLQIVNGQQYLDNYQERTLAEVTTDGTRGNIYDRDGKLLAYNELQYNITIADNGSYDTTNAGINSRNFMLMRLAEIIEKYGYSIEGQYKIKLDDERVPYFTTGSEDERKRFIANIRGRNISDLSDKDFTWDAAEAFEFSKKRYRFDDIKDPDGNTVVISDETALDMINIFYTLRLTAYQRYQTTTIVKNVSEECVAEILEAKGELKGVDIENVSVRKYNYAPYLSHIVGYTGQVRADQLEELRKKDPSYELNDIVGVWGLEKSMESELKGKKGSREMYLNSVGSVLDVVSETDATAGNDIYTTISANDQIAIYHLLEQELAGVLASKITEQDLSDLNANVEQSEITIPVKDAYFQLINNNVLDSAHFGLPEAGEAERSIAATFAANKKNKLVEIQSELLSPTTQGLKELPQDMQAYIVYIYDYMTGKDSGIIDASNQAYRESEAYQAWKDDTINLRDFIIKGIDEAWLDTSKLELSDDYYDTENIYKLFVQLLIEHLNNDPEFDKVLYKYAIADKTIPGYTLLMALFEQGVLKEDPESYQRLATGDEHFAYTFLISKVRKIELTPAQLALDPCNGSVVVTDVKTGKVRALVTYPGFDNNRITEADYLKKCNADLSLPLLNGATQTQLAPGSTFKPLTSIAALQEGVLNLYTVIDCTGVYEEVTPHIKCWIYPQRHGRENVIDGIKNSCNFFFAAVGHMLSTDENGNYNQALGLERIQKYASLFGLDSLSGVEIDEAMPRISDYDPERSAMGQGNHAYNDVQLARYITAVANNGTVFDLSVLDKITAPDGTVVRTIEPKVVRQLDFSELTWNAVHRGLREMITEGVAKRVFQGQDIPIAGKTGTAQEREDRGNHAVFVSYAPYAAPEISVTVNIPYGYSSGNAANLANNVYNYCYGKDSLDAILSRDASYISALNVSD
ncbi:penicillin-binding transpeptidase domain-containing protein [Oribacterium sp. WCC10]|uniref:penicillin-binding transpeptidase domain-containing protein n=1 Tax=Oribacterium sp. WCC10 TaxID=1855343 RepID=UPI0008E3E345|nr:penicillin-binding transpeptidase domain-containing protein [Oribacterium sp. WCC10]SFG08287.1 penicillin-binding protein 2 [Oribacterium sp. WCC10]